jgi:hypothetical protein
VEVLDTGVVGSEWMELEPMPSKRSHVAGALQPRSPYIYAVGGNDGSGPETGRLSSVIRFNMETNHWEPWGEMTTVRRCVCFRPELLPCRPICCLARV